MTDVRQSGEAATALSCGRQPADTITKLNNKPRSGDSRLDLLSPLRGSVGIGDALSHGLRRGLCAIAASRLYVGSRSNSSRVKLAFVVFLLSLISQTGYAEAADFVSDIQPFFAKYCARCHNTKKQEGNFRLDTLARDFTDEGIAQRWAEVVFRMNSGEMPPRDEPQPQPDELGRVVDWLSARISEGRAVRMARRGPVAHYRLSREEYAHTVYDLLGVHFDVNAPGAFNDDPRWHGFERIGSLLSLSPSHVDRYLQAAETVITRAFPDVAPKAIKGRRDDGGMAGIPTEGGPYRAIYWPGVEGNHIHMSSGGTPVKVRIKLSGLQPQGGRAPHLTVWDFVQKKSIFDEDIVAPENKPVVVEFTTTTSSFQLLNAVTGFPGNAHTRSNTARRLVSSRQARIGHPAGYKLFDDEGRPLFPLLLVDSVEWESVPVSDQDRQKREGLFPTSITRNAKAPADRGHMEELLGDCRKSLQRFAGRAWRRPVTGDEVERYVAIVKDELDAGEPFGSAYRSALVGVLVSKNFYYIVEGSAEKPRDQLNDWELASRLSYFLWSSLPDEELLASARDGSLHRPERLKAQLQRMLDDQRIGRFTESFPRQWLQLHRVGMFPPDPGLYPNYDRWLEKSMVLETQAYFGEVFAKNLPIREFLQSDWTMVNPRLATFYQLPQLGSSGFQKVTLRPEDHRGGLLTQAAILSLTSDGTRHRPVHRGVWISEAVFGRTPPSPPPNVEPLEPTPSNKPKATIRDQLEAHATHATCASCHRKIDPLGFAFDNFDAIGSWRTTERVTSGQGENPPVVASGVLPDGRTFNGPDEFTHLLAQDVDRFAEAFIEQLATYALRRVMTIDDREQIKLIAAECRKNNYQLRTVIENLVTSELFLMR